MRFGVAGVFVVLFMLYVPVFRRQYNYFPWFNRVGGGIQYFSGETKILNKKGQLIDATVENLLANNYIREIK
ncbi:TNT domain-containing protein [Listeria booriae]|uniref:TNT domain-containing protein n=1 Tax=Listeria booriae TaxID=1552123 RepID=A0A7X1CDD9_9LIST|nr:hypothetical protein [Listeria booriae]MBC1493324.1 TNT domain-containing protein [Listeria booriae]